MRICLAVKADAYGHGSVPVARAALDEGVDHLAVATVDEAAELRKAAIDAPIVLYSLPIPEELPELVRQRVTPMVADREMLRGLEEEAKNQSTSLTVHLKVDTGMGRVGCRPDDAVELAAVIAGSPFLVLGGVATHFAGSDIRERSYTDSQIETFNKAVDSIRSAGIDPGLVNAANSGAIMHYPAAWYDMVRPGIIAYGYPPGYIGDSALDVRPVMELQSRVVLVKRVRKGTSISYGMTWKAPRETWIGTIPAGYADGYNRLLSNQGEVLIGKDRYPIVGRVCMDQFMVDLGPECRVERFAPVVLFGPQENAPDAAENAGLCSTIPYEVTCAVSRRVPRVYVEEPSPEANR